MQTLSFLVGYTDGCRYFYMIFLHDNNRKSCQERNTEKKCCYLELWQDDQPPEWCFFWDASIWNIEIQIPWIGVFFYCTGPSHKDGGCTCWGDQGDLAALKHKGWRYNIKVCGRGGLQQIPATGNIQSYEFWAAKCICFELSSWPETQEWARPWWRGRLCR